LLGGGSDAGLIEDARRWVDHQPNPVGVSLPALGETFMELMCKPEMLPEGVPSPFKRCVDLVRGGRLEVCWLNNHNPPGGLLSLAGRMQKAMSGRKFGATDSIILACAVLCTRLPNL
jgi:hypothetical protein